MPKYNYDRIQEESQTRPPQHGCHNGWCVILWTVMIGDAARGILFPTLWPLVSSLGGNRITQGFTVAAFSFGRIISSPFWGSLSETKSYRFSLLGAMSCAFTGAVMYTFAWSIATLIISQIMIGFGAGSLGVTRAWVAASTTMKRRTLAMARLTALQFFGFTVTPFFGSGLVVLLGDDEFSFLGGLIRVTKFTAPAYTLIACFTLGIILLVTIFEEPVPPTDEEATAVVVEVSNVSQYRPVRVDDESKTERDVLTRNVNEPTAEQAQTALIMGLVLNIVTRGVIGCFEAMGTAVSPLYNIDPTHAGFIVSSCGLIGTVELLLFKYIVDCAGDVNLIELGLAACAAGALAMQFHQMFAFVVAVFCVYTIGYTVGNTAALAMYSKAAGSSAQGFVLGIFGSAGAGARIVFPILAGFIVHYIGERVLFILLAVISACTVVAVAYCRNSLVSVTSH